MRRLTTTAAAEQPQTTPRPVMHLSALITAWLLMFVALCGIAYLRELAFELVFRIEVAWIVATCVIMLCIGPLKALVDMVSEMWGQPEPVSEARDRIVPVNAQRPVSMAGENRPALPPGDLAYMIDQLEVTGVSVRAWRGQKLPSGHVIRSELDESYRAFIDILVSNGWLRGRTDRSAGKLTANHVEIRAALEEAGVLP